MASPSPSRLPWTRVAVLFVLANVVYLAAAHVLAQPVRQGTPRTANVQGAVSGTVTDAVTSLPLAGAYVQLRPPPGRGAGTQVVSAFTDERGRFVFTRLDAGNYFVSAQKGGYADGQYGPTLNGAGGAAVVLTPGAWFDAANVALVKLAAISGRVLDEHGEPVVGAFVRAFASVRVGGGSHLVGSLVATTDDRGEYRISGLRPGRYFVSVPSSSASVPASWSVSDIEGLSTDQLNKRDAQGPPQRRGRGELVDGPTALVLGSYPTPPAEGHTQTYPTMLYPGTTSLAAAMPIDVTSNDQAGIDVTLTPVPAVSVSGRLTGGSAPYSGIVLRLVPPELEELADGSEAATAAVEADGTFTFLRVPSGHYVVTGAPTFGWRWAARSTGQSLTRLPETPGVSGYLQSGGLTATDGLGSSQRSASPAEARQGFERVAVDVGTAGVTGLVVPIEPPSAIHGDVVFEEVTGPAPGGGFDLSPVGEAPTPGTSVVPVKGTPPTFDFPLLAAGDYDLRYVVPSLLIKSITVNGEDHTRQPIRVLPGAVARVVVTVTGNGTTLSGTVRDGTGAAVPAAGIIAFPVDQMLWPHSSAISRWIGLSIASTIGTYRLTSLGAGDYYVVAVDAAHWDAYTDPTFLSSLVPAAARVSLDWGATKTVDVPFVVKR